ncbi:hypothetical protein SLA2020_126740 [Shorea laevis]
MRPKGPHEMLYMTKLWMLDDEPVTPNDIKKQLIELFVNAFTVFASVNVDQNSGQASDNLQPCPPSTDPSIHLEFLDSKSPPI